MKSIENFEKKIVPLPVNVKKGSGAVNLGNVSEPLFTFECIGAGDLINSAKQCIYNAFSEYMISAEKAAGTYRVTLKTDSSDKRFEGKGKKEGYLIDINKDGADIIGFDDAGTFYGAVTFAQILFCEGSNAYVPQCTIIDYPHFEKRGHFMECRYGSDFMTLQDWKKAIDYFAYQKINVLNIALYGCWVRQYDGEFAEYQYIPFEKYPELKTPRSVKYYSAKQKKYIFKDNALPVMYEEDYFGEMIAYAKKKNIEVYPLFNSLGHNTLLPRVIPEISAKDENGNPTGVAFCTRDEKTYEVMFNIYDEIIDRYLAPNGIDTFHVGLDEINNVGGIDKNNLNVVSSAKCSCKLCKDTEQIDLVLAYIVKLVKHLKEKGMKTVYIYYDTLAGKAKAVNEKTVDYFKKEGVYENIVIDWWDYRNSDTLREGFQWEQSHLFRGIAKPTTGYYHWNCFTDSTDNILGMTKLAVEHKFEGLVAYSSFEYCYDYTYELLAECAWNPGAALDGREYEKYCECAFPENPDTADVMKEGYKFWRSACEKNNITTGVFMYYPYSYHFISAEYPQDFPAKTFRKISEEEDKYIGYAQECIKTMKEVYTHFDKMNSWKADVFKHTAQLFIFHNDYFKTLYECNKKYAIDGDVEFFKNEAERLLNDADNLISFTEDVRIKANQYTMLRNISVFRQSLCDLLEYIENSLKTTKKPEIDLMNFGQYLSSTSKFLR